MARYVPYDGLPTWFNEGTAGAISNAPPWSGASQAAVDDLAAVATTAGWEAVVADRNRILPMYCQARREIEAWFAEHDDSGRELTAVLRNVANGMPFETAYTASRQGRASER